MLPPVALVVLGGAVVEVRVVGGVVGWLLVVGAVVGFEVFVGAVVVGEELVGRHVVQFVQRGPRGLDECFAEVSTYTSEATVFLL